MTFTTRNLAGDRTLIQGEDQFGSKGKLVVDNAEWGQLKKRQEQLGLIEDFDAKVAEFFKPLTDASEALAKAQATVNTDPAFYVVVKEGTEGVAPEAEEIVHLSKEAVILRLIEENANTDRLIWITDSSLEILEASQTAAPVEDAQPTLPGFEDGQLPPAAAQA